MTTFDRPKRAYENAENQFWKRALLERGYIVSEAFTVAADGGTVNLHLENPDGTGVTAFFTAVESSTQFESIIEVFDTFTTAPSSGTAVTIDNLLMDRDSGDDEGSLNANRNASFDGESVHSQTAVGGGQGAQIIGATGGLPLFGMEENREIVIRVTNQSSNSDDATITVAYFEIDELFST